MFQSCLITCIPIWHTSEYSCCMSLRFRPRSSCGLRRVSAAAGWLEWQVQTPLKTWLFACYACQIGLGLCDGLITRSEESYRLCKCLNCVWSRNPNNEAAQARVWLLLHATKTQTSVTRLLIPTHARFHWLKFIKNILKKTPTCFGLRPSHQGVIMSLLKSLLFKPQLYVY